MDKKRKASSEDERAMVRELVLERRDVVENKKSDMVSLIAKKRAWEEITAKFNSSGLYSHRTPAQIKKMWENLKTKRRLQLATEKKDVMRTGGGPSTVTIPEDPELDSVGVDIELREEAIDSDTLLAGSAAYVLVGDTLVPTEEEVDAPVTVDVPPRETPGSPDLEEGSGRQEVTSASRTRSKTVSDEISARMERNEQLIKRDEELHSFKLLEQQLKNKLVEKQIQREELLIQQDKEIFELKKKKLLLEIQQLGGEE